ncbi:hypothetical protein ACWDPV_08205 [Gordonia sp. NPDC003504]
MKLTDSINSHRRPSKLFALANRRGRRQARMFPAEAERLATPAELKRLAL